MAVTYPTSIQVKLQGTGITSFDVTSSFTLENKVERTFEINAVSTPESVDFSDVSNAKHLMFYSTGNFNINMIKEFTVPAVAEVITTTITAEATSNGDIIITLPGEAPAVIAILDLDTYTQIINKIVATPFVKWTPTVGVTLNTVVFTQKAAYAGDTTTLISVDAGTTGMTSTSTVTTKGKDALTFDYPLTIPSKANFPTLLHIDQTFISSIKSLTLSTTSENLIKIAVSLYGVVVPTV